MHAMYKTHIARLAEDAAKCEIRLIVTQVGLVIGAVAMLGVIVRWPGVGSS